MSTHPNAPVRDEEAEMAEQQKKPLWRSLLPVMACGAGLFSDGYINSVIGSVVTILALQYGDVWENSNAQHIIGAIAFAGTVLGQLVFGYLSDKWSRTGSLLVSTVILVIFTILSAASYYHGDVVGMFKIMAAWRFFVGIGIGGEYPAGSVSAAESTSELKAGTRNTFFILFTNSMINWVRTGFVFGAFVPYLVAAIYHNTNFTAIWRISLGVGALFPSLILLSLPRPRPHPYRLTLRFYGSRLLVISLIWFIYDFGAYSFGIYSSILIANLFDSSRAPLTIIFGWNTFIDLLSIPGTLLGAPLSDLIGPRYALAGGVTAQAIVGFGMAANYARLAQPANVGAFSAVYGLFLSLAEVGPGNNIGLLAAKTCATGVRGQYYGVAAAMGKIGAFVGTLLFPYIVRAGGGGRDDVGAVAVLCD
ncbi:glycerophosphoinositol permease [Collariella sp. IMI 366227]|nr:glycerophosphoinositol permease [Collariella sp. IMI 366227]